MVIIVQVLVLEVGSFEVTTPDYLLGNGGVMLLTKAISLKDFVVIRNENDYARSGSQMLEGRVTSRSGHWSGGVGKGLYMLSILSPCEFQGFRII